MFQLQPLLGLRLSINAFSPFNAYQHLYVQLNLVVFIAIPRIVPTIDTWIIFVVKAIGDRSVTPPVRNVFLQVGFLLYRAEDLIEQTYLH